MCLGLILLIAFDYEIISSALIQKTLDLTKNIKKQHGFAGKCVGKQKVVTKISCEFSNKIYMILVT